MIVVFCTKVVIYGMIILTPYPTFLLYPWLELVVTVEEILWKTEKQDNFDLHGFNSFRIASLDNFIFKRYFNVLALIFPTTSLIIFLISGDFIKTADHRYS